jgi:hypothetical protein
VRGSSSAWVYWVCLFKMTPPLAAMQRKFRDGDNEGCWHLPWLLTFGAQMTMDLVTCVLGEGGGVISLQ